MKLIFFTDPHLGLERNSHTTPASRGKLKQDVYRQLRKVFAEEGDFYICAGDLFDKYTVDNATLLQGLYIYKSCDLVVAGNHDSSNRSNAISSMDVLVDIQNTERLYTGVDSISLDNLSNLVYVNHQMTQDLFIEALDTAKNKAKSNSILVLHCNYDSPFIHDDSSLNLTREKAQELLNYFSYVVLGHEHQHRTDFDGRLFILGNTHPTSFADISDKYYWVFERQEDSWTVTPHLIWSQDNGLLELDISDLDKITKLPELVQFIDVTGKAGRDKMPVIAKQVADLWLKSDTLLMVRNNVTCEQDKLETPVAPKNVSDIPAQVTKALAGTDLEVIWRQYLEAVCT